MARCGARCRRALALVAAAAVLVVCAAPVLIGYQLRTELASFAPAGLDLLGLPRLQVRVTQAGAYRTVARCTLRGAALVGDGTMTFEHSPRILLSGAAGWPGLLRGAGTAHLQGAALAGRYRTESGPLSLGARVMAPLVGPVQVELDLAPGVLELPGASLALHGVRARLRAEPHGAAAMPFTLAVHAEAGRLDADGTAAAGTVSATVRLDHNLARAVAAGLLSAELTERAVPLPPPEALARLAELRLEALVALGLLRVAGPRVYTEIEFGVGGLRVFGSPVRPKFDAAPTPGAPGSATGS